MSVPTHSFACYTKMFQAACPSCSEDVYYFSCSCGSKVFFDKKGWPWEPHECLEYRLSRELDLIQNVDRMTPDEMYKAVIKHEKRSGEEISERVWQIIENSIGKRKSKLTIQKVDAVQDRTEISGHIMEFNKPINIFKRLGYDPDNQMSTKMLGKIGTQDWAYLRVRTNPDRKNQCLEFELFVRLHTIARTGAITKGKVILGIANKASHFKGSFWELQSYTFI